MCAVSDDSEEITGVMMGYGSLSDLYGGVLKSTSVR
jgi:hypothetical protein